MPAIFSEVIVWASMWLLSLDHVLILLKSNAVKTNRVILFDGRDKLDAGSRRPIFRSVEYVARFPNEMRQMGESA